MVAGEWSHAGKVLQTTSQRKVSRILSHPRRAVSGAASFFLRYGSDAPSDYDFALLELESAMPINECIGLACLPYSADASNQGCSITGWGVAESGPRPTILQEASVTMVDSAACAQRYAEHNSSVTASMLCATGHSASGVTDACHGDSGGPLVCEEQGSFVVRGVTSWGFGCASAKFPGVYGRVWSAIDWIYETMASREQLPDVDFGGMMWAVTKGPCKRDESGCISAVSVASRLA